MCTLRYDECLRDASVDAVIDDCVEFFAEDGRDRAISAKEPCLPLYADFFACAATWTCEEFFHFTNSSPDASCQSELGDLQEFCPGVSPLKFP